MVITARSGQRVRRAISGCLLAAGMALACSESQGPGGGHPLPPSPFVVSNPVPRPAPATSATRSPLASMLLDSTVVYVSLPPGTISDSSVSISNRKTGSSVIATVINGGLDPVALGASVGDTIEVTAQGGGGPQPVSYIIIVSATSRPRVIRTNPPNHKRDVALNAVVHIIFSEPLDEATVNNAGVQLHAGATLINGTLQFSDSRHLAVEFIPTALLSSSTDYELEVTESIQDLDGEPLAAPVTVQFTTGTIEAPVPTAIHKLDGDAQTRPANHGRYPLALVVDVTDQYGNWLEGQAVTWTIESGPVAFVTIGGATDPSGRSVAVLAPSGAPGAAVVRASVQGGGPWVDFELTVEPPVWIVNLNTVGSLDGTFVSVQNGSRSPAVDTIPVGETMTWRLEPWFDYPSFYGVISLGTPSFEGADYFPYEDPSTVSVTFTIPGTYRYIDPHIPGDEGVVVVQ